MRPLQGAGARPQLEAVLTADEYAKRVQATVLSAGARTMELTFPHQPNAASGLYALAIGGASAVRGKGREHEREEGVQGFEHPGARAVDWLAEARDEMTDCAAWLTGADCISRMDDTERSKYRDALIWHLACAIDALDSWLIFERTAQHTQNPTTEYREYIRPEDQPA